MALTGFVKLYRSLLDWEWHDDPATFTVFVHLLLMANFAPCDWRGIPLQPGQVVTGRKTLAEKTGLTERQVRTALTRLKTSNCVTIETTSRFSIISFVKWEKYQVPDQWATSEVTGNSTNERPTNDQPTTNERPQRNKARRKEGGECEEGSSSRKRFTPPTVDEVEAYCRERGNRVDAQRFVDFYASSGWLRGKTPIRDWRACVRTWERRSKEDAKHGVSGDDSGSTTSFWAEKFSVL